MKDFSKFTKYIPGINEGFIFTVNNDKYVDIDERKYQIELSIKQIPKVLIDIIYDYDYYFSGTQVKTFNHKDKINPIENIFNNKVLTHTYDDSTEKFILHGIII